MSLSRNLRIPYGSFPDKARPIEALPGSATTVSGAISALRSFLDSSSKPVVMLTGAGISTDSGIPDYRGENGTYTTNKRYRPIFYNEFVRRHRSRQRYFARSFLGFPPVQRGRPNAGHEAAASLLRAGLISNIITQNVDGLHSYYHSDLPVLELHGSLMTVRCLSCGSRYSRADFQKILARLNPMWAELLESFEKGQQLRTNPDGDVELPEAPYETFRYPACESCSHNGKVKVDSDGAWTRGEGILKPSVIFFGESVSSTVRHAAEEAISQQGNLLVVGSSLATYSAFRLLKLTRSLGKPIGILNLGSVRGDAMLSRELGDLRIEHGCTEILTGVVETLEIAGPGCKP